MDVFCFVNYFLRLAGQIAENESVYTLSLIAERAGPVKDRVRHENSCRFRL
jgi:hypothetical protein